MGPSKLAGCGEGEGELDGTSRTARDHHHHRAWAKAAQPNGRPPGALGPLHPRVQLSCRCAPGGAVTHPPLSWAR